MEMTHAEYIALTAEEMPTSLEAINGGLSQAGKYRATFGSDVRMVKLLRADERRLTWYMELMKRADKSMAVPGKVRLFDDGTLCLISPWISGESLEHVLASASEIETAKYGRAAAGIVAGLHRDSIEYPSFAISLRQRVGHACAEVNRLGLTFPGHKKCVDFLLDEIKLRHPSRVSFVHMDLRPENFILSDGELYLIDFDNGTIGERASDFAYLTTMARPDHRSFSRALIKSYLGCADSEAFWRDNLFYSTLAVTEYAIWKWNTKGRQVCYQAQNLMQQYDNLTSVIPKWWKEN